MALFYLLSAKFLDLFQVPILVLIRLKKNPLIHGCLPKAYAYCWLQIPWGSAEKLNFFFLSLTFYNNKMLY